MLSEAVVSQVMGAATSPGVQVLGAWRLGDLRYFVSTGLGLGRTSGELRWWGQENPQGRGPCTSHVADAQCVHMSGSTWEKVNHISVHESPVVLSAVAVLSQVRLRRCPWRA